MFLESMIGLAGCYVAYRKVNEDSIQARKDKKEIKKSWKVLMDSLGVKSENKIEQRFELLKIIPKHYGWDAIISLPASKKFTDIKTMIPQLETVYKANCMVEWSPDKSSCFLRVHNLDKDISDKDNLKFRWFKTFYGIKNATNEFGETLKILDVKEIKSPFDQVVGYKIVSKIPLGVSYKNVLESYDIISRTLGKCYFDFDSAKMELSCSIIHVAFDNMVKFAPIKVKPWELFIGMAYSWDPIIIDYSLNPNWLDGGNTRTGKTVAVITGFLNLCLSSNNFKMFVGSYGEKQDLAIFKQMPQCLGFATSKLQILGMLNYISKEVARRYKVFAAQKEPCMNIFQYNKRVKDEDKMEVWHFLTDEVADLVEDDDIQKVIWSLARKGAGAGVFCTIATQRATLANLSAEIKAMLTNKSSFSQANSSSAMTIMGGIDKTTDMVMSLEKKREFVIDYHEGIIIGKTLYLDEDMMSVYLKKLRDVNHKPYKFNSDGTIKDDIADVAVQEVEVKATETKTETKPKADVAPAPKESKWDKKHPKEKKKNSF